MKKKTKQLKTKDQTGTRIRVQFDFDYKGSPGKEMDEDQQTVPDMNMSVTQIMQRHSRGQDGSISAKQPFYFETRVPVFHDLLDIENYKEHLDQKKQEVEEFLAMEKDRIEAEKEQKEKEEAEKQAEKQTEKQKE